MKKELQDSYENSMSEMQKMVEKTLKETSAAHEKMVRMLREDLDKAQRETESVRNEHDHAEQRRTMIQLGLIVPAVVGTGLGLPCSIL